MSKIEIKQSIKTLIKDTSSRINVKSKRKRNLIKKAIELS
jgi:hypothetical protein